jgi:hypothetical protein
MFLRNSLIEPPIPSFLRLSRPAERPTAGGGFVLPQFTATANTELAQVLSKEVGGEAEMAQQNSHACLALEQCAHDPPTVAQTCARPNSVSVN